ncbi:MAG: FtsX-like permease family protein [Bacteroidota bacterium]
MSKNIQNDSPPKLALRLLNWFLKPELLEEVLGDLEEKFQLVLETNNYRKARINYWFQMVNYLRPFAIRKSIISFPNFTIMFKHSFLMTYRNLLRHTSTFLINLMGLSIGLCVAFLILLWVQDEFNVDRFHENDENLYQVMKNASRPEGDVLTFDWTPALLPAALKEDFPEVKYAVSSILRMEAKKGIIVLEKERIKALEHYVGTDFFKVFSYELIHGQTENVLQDQNSVVLSNSLAEKIFGRVDKAIGQTIEWDKEDFSGLYQITGVFEDPPKNSTAKFDLLFSFDKYAAVNPEVNDWKYGDPSTYVVLQDGTALDAFNSKISNYLQEKSGEEYQSLFAIKYSSKYLNGNFKNGKQSGGRITYVRLFQFIAVLILLIACINFMNLSTAKASRRMKEIGVKKAFGVERRQLITQYIMEATFMVVFSFIVAIFLTAISLPTFNSLLEKDLHLALDPNLIFYAGILILVTSLVAGSYPAFYLSNFKAISIINGSNTNKGGAKNIRKALVLFQFVVSVVLIALVLVINQQIDYIQSKDLGYDQDHLLMFKKEGKIASNLTTFLEELRKFPEVIHASNTRDGLLENGTGTIGLSWPGEAESDQIRFKYLTFNYDALETLNIKLKDGRSFSPQYGTDSVSIIFNEEAIKQMGLEHPVGQYVTQWRTRKQIIGVVENFHFESLYANVEPCFIQFSDDGENILVRLRGGNEKSGVDEISNLFAEYNPGVAFEYQFVDEQYRTFYKSETKIAQLSIFATALAIVISCLGLLGLIIFSAERRKKEIGIRKVLGASVFNLSQLITWEFIKIITLAVVIAAPVAYFIASRWLEHFAYHIDLNIWYFVFAGGLTLLLSWIIMSIQTIRAASVNPITVLKTE